MDLTTPTTARRVTVGAWAGAVFGTIAGQLHAIARGLSHPEDWQEAPLNRAWAEPASRALAPLFNWADPWTVYLTYGKVWTPVAITLTLAAILVFQRRRPEGAERRLWQVVLGGHLLVTVSIIGDYFLAQWMSVFFAAGLAAMLLIAAGGTALGVVLISRGFRPRLTALILVGFVPLVVLLTMVTSLGSVLLPLAWGWAVATHHGNQRTRPQTSAVTAFPTASSTATAT